MKKLFQLFIAFTLFLFNLPAFAGGGYIPGAITETDPVYSASPAASVTSEKINLWDSALQIEVDPAFTLSPAASITTENINSWNSKLDTESDPVFSASDVFGVTSTDISNWNAKLDAETDPVFTADTSVTKQGNTFNGASQLVQMTAATKLPAVDGSALTNLPTSLDTINTETLTGNKTLDNSSASFQYLNPNTINRTITLSKTGISTGKKITIKNTQSTSNSSYLLVKNDSTNLKFLYSQDVGSYIYNGSDWIPASTGSDDSIYNTSYGSTFASYGNGSSFGYQAQGYNIGAGFGYQAYGHEYGAAFGGLTEAKTKGTALGYSCKAYDFSICIGAYAKADAVDGTSLYNIAIGGGTAADATVSVSTKAATITAGNTTSIAIGHDSYINGSRAIVIGAYGKGYYTDDVLIGTYTRDGGSTNGGIAIGSGSGQSSGNKARGSNGAYIEAGYGIAVGNDTEVSGSYGVAIGKSNKATKSFSIALGSDYTYTTRYGEQKTNSGAGGATGGNYSRSTVSWLRSTANATPVEIFLDGPSTNTERLILQASSAMTFSILVTARDNVSNHYGSYEIKGACKRDASNNSTCTATTTVIVEDDAAWDITASADDTNDALILTVTGDDTNPTQWNAIAQISETHF